MATTVEKIREQRPAREPLGTLVAELTCLEAILSRRRDAPGERHGPPDAPAPRMPSLARLCDVFDLDRLDADLVLLALAPELDARYQQILAEIQGSPLRRRSSVGLALELMTRNAEERLAARARFDPASPLMRWGILAVEPDPVPGCDGLASRMLRLDASVVAFLVNDDSLDESLAPVSHYLTIAATDAELPSSIQDLVDALEDSPASLPDDLRLRFVGAEGTGRRRAAGRVAAALGRPVLSIDLAKLLDSGGHASHLWRASLRDARLHGALLCLTGMSSANERDWLDAGRGLSDELWAWPLPVILIGQAEAFEGTRCFPDALRFDFEDTSPQRRVALWHHYAEHVGLAIGEGDLRRMTRRFRLTRREIESATLQVAAAARLPLPVEDAARDSIPMRLAAAARTVRGAALERFADRIRPARERRDLVLPTEPLDQLDELIRRIENASTVEDEWGFATHITRARGVSVLFTGASGTGKTMAAEVIARELGLDLFKARMSGVISKYIGETEKNLEQLFDAAERSNGILFFDEAEALFGKRSEVRDSHDRYANQEISYLLQRMERFDGVAILATNLHDHLDDAFRRRLTATIHFPFPDAGLRRELWRRIWPADAPLDDSVDLDWLARTLEVAGGSIRNIAVAAAFYAADQGRPIGIDHLVLAARREYEKLGRGATPIADTDAPTRASRGV